MKKIYLSLYVFVLSLGATRTEVPGVEITADEGSYFIAVKLPVKSPVAIVFRQKSGVAHANTIVVQGYKVNAQTGALEDRKAVTLDTISDKYAMRIDTSKPVTYKISAFIPKNTDPQSRDLVDVTEYFTLHGVTTSACEKLSYEPLMLKDTVTLWQKKGIRIALAGAIIVALAALYFISRKYRVKSPAIELKKVDWDGAKEPPKYAILMGGGMTGPYTSTSSATSNADGLQIVLEYSPERGSYVYPTDPIEPLLFSRGQIKRTVRRGDTEVVLDTANFGAGDISDSNSIAVGNMYFTKALFFN